MSKVVQNGVKNTEPIPVVKAIATATLATDDDVTDEQQPDPCFVSAFKVLAILIIVIAGAIYLNPTRVNPSSFVLASPPDVDVSYSLNFAESIFRAKRSLKGPESVAISPSNGYLYAGTQDGKIIKARLDKPYSAAPETIGMIGDPNAALPLPCGTHTTEPICGRPLGMEMHTLRFGSGDEDDVLFVVDAYYGIYQYMPSHHYLMPVLTLEKGIKFANFPDVQLTKRDPIFFNDLTLDKKGLMLYFTISSHKYRLNELFYEMLDNGENGMVCSYNLVTREVNLVLHNLAFPNGIIFHPKTGMIYVAELGRARILQVNVSSHHKKYKFGEATILVRNLPLLPDNMALVGDDEIWVAGTSLRVGKINNAKDIDTSIFPWDLPFTNKSLYEWLLQSPTLRKILAKAVPLQFSSYFTQNQRGGIVRLQLLINPKTQETAANVIELMVASKDHKNHNSAPISQYIASVTPFAAPELPKGQIYVYLGGYSPEVSSIGRLTWDLKNKKPILAQHQQARKDAREKYRRAQEIKEQQAKEEL